MSNYIPGNQKHLTLNDRLYIENELAKGLSLRDRRKVCVKVNNRLPFKQ
ncbi:hypothetical protein [Ruminococcus intestinalis]